MALFNVDLRRESVKAAHAFGSMLGERVNKAAWKSYMPALVDLIIAADRGDETAADKVDALLVDGITMNDLIALGAACKVVGLTMGGDIARVIHKIAVAAENDPEAAEMAQRAIGGYQTAMDAMRPDNACGIGAPSGEDAEETRRGIALAAEDARSALAALVAATDKLSKAKQLSIMRTYAEMACNIIDCTGCDVEFGDMSDYKPKFQAAVVAEMMAANVPAHVIECYKQFAAEFEPTLPDGYFDV